MHFHSRDHHQYEHHHFQPSSGKKSKSKRKSTLTVLTLLAFFFFINLLQGCLKEHMDAMNPTVMVMTAGVGRTPLQNLLIGRLGSREVTSEPDAHEVVIINSRNDYHPEDKVHYRNTSLSSDNYNSDMEDIGTYYTRIN